MVRERNGGHWALPGGWADVNQTAGQCVAREIEEESRFSARAVKLCAVRDRARHGHTPPHPFYVYKMFSCARSPEASRARASKRSWPNCDQNRPANPCPRRGSTRRREQRLPEGATQAAGARPKLDQDTLAFRS